MQDIFERRTSDGPGIAFSHMASLVPGSEESSELDRLDGILGCGLTGRLSEGSWSPHGGQRFRSAFP
jgi:hypothetical protein